MNIYWNVLCVVFSIVYILDNLIFSKVIKRYFDCLFFVDEGVEVGCISYLYMLYSW